MNCKICNNDTKVIFNREVLHKYKINYHQCTTCSFIQTDEPFWLDEAYKDPINIDDTGLISRNLMFAKRSSAVLFYLFNSKKKFLDFAGGYGLFTRLMRDYGFDFYWMDPFTQNLFAKGFEFNHSSKQKIEAVTAFECFEHFVQPLNEIENLIKLSDNILFSTKLFTVNTPKPDEWDYYAFSHGQHIAFYSRKTLKFIAKKYGLNLYSNGKSFHLLTRRKTNNTLFNFLLKLSLLAFPELIRFLMGTKIFSDSQLIINKKKQQV